MGMNIQNCLIEESNNLYANDGDCKRKNKLSS